jgi:hypothetical protein
LRIIAQLEIAHQVNLLMPLTRNRPSQNCPASATTWKDEWIFDTNPRAITLYRPFAGQGCARDAPFAREAFGATELRHQDDAEGAIRHAEVRIGDWVLI